MNKKVITAIIVIAIILIVAMVIIKNNGQTDSSSGDSGTLQETYQDFNTDDTVFNALDETTGFLE